MAEAPDPSTEVLGDFNQDGHVTAADITAMENALANSNSCMLANGLSNADLLAIGDLNGDGVVNNADLQAFLDYLKAGHGSTSVPEPNTFVLAVLAALMLTLIPTVRLR